jgi:hypothetical protein
LTAPSGALLQAALIVPHPAQVEREPAHVKTATGLWADRGSLLRLRLNHGSAPVK